MDRPNYILANTMIPFSHIAEWIRNDPRYAGHVEECVLMLVVADFPSTLEYFTPSNAVAEAAIRSEPNNIGRINNPKRKLQILAVSLKPGSIRLIARPCKEAQSIAAIMA